MPLIDAMTPDDPEERLSAPDAYKMLLDIRGKIPPKEGYSRLRLRLLPESALVGLIRDAEHAFRYRFWYWRAREVDGTLV